MAEVTVAHHPELTIEDAMGAFTTHFGDRYEVYKTRALDRDFILKESAAMGVSVKLKQEPNATAFVFTWVVPAPILRLLFVDVFALLFLRRRREAMEQEVRSFIASAPEFH